MYHTIDIRCAMIKTIHVRYANHKKFIMVNGNTHGQPWNAMSISYPNSINSHILVYNVIIECTDCT